MLGIPHLSKDDDVYEGMFIPGGTTIISNIRYVVCPIIPQCTLTNISRGMGLDESVYQNPHQFDPTRYSRGEPYFVDVFGFGRRSV
jgi:hypothetical protein